MEVDARKVCKSFHKRVQGTPFMMNLVLTVVRRPGQLSGYANNEVAFWLIVALPAIISELSITLWLLIKGVNVERWKKRALESA